LPGAGNGGSSVWQRRSRSERDSDYRYAFGRAKELYRQRAGADEGCAGTANLAEAGLDDLVDLREGDALETLARDLPEGESAVGAISVGAVRR
jgi:hypothetical protein